MSLEASAMWIAEQSRVLNPDEEEFIPVKVVKLCWCGSPVAGRGLCNKHYLRHWRQGLYLPGSPARERSATSSVRREGLS